MKPPRRNRRGSVTIEMALIGLLFFVVLIGIADVGQFLFLQQAIAERARAAARWGATTDPTNTTAITNMVLYLQPAAPPNRAASFGLTPAMVSITTPDQGTDNYRLLLRITGYTYQVLSPYLAGRYQGSPIQIAVPLGAYQ